MRDRAQPVRRRHRLFVPQPDLKPSLRANGSRECATDDRLREAIHMLRGKMDCFVADAPRNDAALTHPNLRLRHSISLALTSSGFSCCVQWPLPRTKYFSRSGTIFSMPSAADGGSTRSFSAMIIIEGTRTVWSMSAERCQLRDMLRYQLMPPVKPDFVKVSTNTCFSSGERIGARGSCLAS